MGDVTVLKKKKRCSIKKTIRGKPDLVKKKYKHVLLYFQNKELKKPNFLGKI